MSSSSSSKAGDDEDGAGSSNNNNRPWSSVAEAAAASQQHHHAALRDRYELLCVRGKGSFAEVWEARHRRTGHKVAIKIISHHQQGQQQQEKEKEKEKEKERKKMIAREIRVMRLLSQGQHPHVIRFYEAISSSTHTYIVMELADAGQLYDHVVLQGRLPEDQARRIFRQLASAVLFCHRNKVAHRDLKMENVLLLRTRTQAADTIMVKVVDFGFSKPYTDAKPTMRKKMGSPEYAAPELFSSSRYVGPQVDVWSCGVILYGMLCGGLPFDGADGDVADLARNVRRGEYRVPSWISDDARDLIAGMLIVRPSKRLTMADVMAHRWLHHHSSETDTTVPAYLLAMPPSPEMMVHHQVDVDEVVVEQMVTRHGFDRSSLLESLLQQNRRRQADHQQDDDEEEAAAVAYQLVLATMPDAATRYLNLCTTMCSMSSPPPPPQWALTTATDGGGVLLRDCPRLTMERIVAVLEEMRIPVLACHRRRHRIKCCAHVQQAPPAAGVGGEMNNNNDGSSCLAAVSFEIQVYKTTTTTIAAGGGDPHHHPQSYVVHLNRTSGPQIPYLNICSQLSSRLRRQN